jgi:hypothetical protein
VEEAYIIEDAAGGRIELVNHAGELRPPALPLLAGLPAAAFADQTMLGCLKHDWDRDRLVMEPVAIVTEAMIVRLGY